MTETADQNGRKDLLQMGPKTTATGRPAALLLALTAAFLLALAVLLPAGAQARSGNSDPWARDDAYSVEEDTVLTVGRFAGVLSNDGDRQNNRLFAKLVRNTSHGAVGLNRNGSFAYDSNDNHNGGDYFSYRACEQQHPAKCSPIRLVRLTVAPVNDAPVANGNHYYLYEGQSKTYAAPSVLGNDTDADGDALSVAGYTGAGRKVGVNLSPGGSMKLVADKDAAGRYSFTYNASDAGGLTDEATVTFRVRHR